MQVLVVGTGYVGLTTSVALAYLGHNVVCLDIDEHKIEILNKGELPIYEPHLAELIVQARSNLSFVTQYDEAKIEHADVIFISVGTPSLPDGSANLAYVKMAAEQIGSRLGNKFTVIVNKSTVPIGSGNWVGALVRDRHFLIHFIPIELLWERKTRARWMY